MELELCSLFSYTGYSYKFSTHILLETVLEICNDNDNVII